MSPAGASLVVERVGKRFGARVRALEDVSFALEPGELVLLSGPSGSGKSTLLNLIAGFDRPDAGRILVDGTAVAELRDPARYRRETIGFVFQLHHLILGLTAEENVEVALIPERVALARALVNGPRLLLADEPTGALDSAAGVQVLELLERLRRVHGMTVLLVSHQPEAAAHADRTLLIRDGHVAPVAGKADRSATPATRPAAGA